MRRYFLVSFIGIIAIFLIIVLSMDNKEFLKWRYGVRNFGPFKLGASMPFGGPGGSTMFAPPYNLIPPARFHVYIGQPDLGCVDDMCDWGGAVVKIMGGYLEVEDIDQPGEMGSWLGFDDRRIRKKYSSVMAIGDHNGKTVGIFPNKDIDDLPNILRLYPELANFSLLQGVSEYGPLKLGALAPRKPGDLTGYDGKQPSRFPLTRIPPGKKFYVYAIQQDLLGQGYCAFYTCLTQPGYFDYVEELGGWFSSDGTLETAQAFGLDPKKVASGEESIVVVANVEARIVAIHPGKTRKDILAILRQLPQLADFTKL